MAKEFQGGSVICESGQPLTSLYMILKGTVRAVYSDGEFFLEKGDIIGLCEMSNESYLFSYIASDEVTIAPVPYKQSTGLSAMFKKQPDFAQITFTSSLKQMRSVLEAYETSKYDCDTLYHYLIDSYQKYTVLCEHNQISPQSLAEMEGIEPITLEKDEDIPQWLISYYKNMAPLMTKALQISSTLSCGDFINGLLMKISLDIRNIMSVCRILSDYKFDIINLLINENRLDLFDLYTSLHFRVGQHAEDSDIISASISKLIDTLEDYNSSDHDFYQARVKEYKDSLDRLEITGLNDSDESHDLDKYKDAVAGSLNTILSYAGCDAEVAAQFRKVIDDFKKLIDKNSTEDASRRLRLNMTKLFYQIYSSAFQTSLKDAKVPTILKMFFLFGYVDEELAGIENAAYLYSLADNYPSNPDNQVYTIYEWLRAVYEGRKEPSRNEFDTDYAGYIHELRINGKISIAQEKEMASDNMQKFLFELENMFPLVNKITFGRLSTFCPVFSEHNVLKDLRKSLVTAEELNACINEIRQIDFGAFYRETIYSDPSAGVPKEFVNVEVLPDFILTPNIGIRGVMWQEIEGKRRTTPARMMISVFHLEELMVILARLAGEFRWEMCKRIQGARWNDVAERSLTSEYFEYIQFYKKNRELTPEAKDKIKSSMQKAKNSYKEMFVRDYIIWILFEGKGSPRLNKVARNILFTHCPFSKAIRESLKTNPLYSDILNRYDIRVAQKLHHMDNLYQKLKNSGLPIPDEIAVQRAFLES
ncbi:MAG: cyclic nucleotide-binding domain-containing protein [Lachnospiraceae bacterium]|nr:cyclic nucleotide-binding domain-containing protein [Lachnospiraceae bacterium]